MHSQDNVCICCHSELKPRQPAIQCDRCSSWQHRTCGTGVTRTQYRQAAKGEIDLAWKCPRCVKLLSLHRRSPLRRFERNRPKLEKTKLVKDFEESESEEESLKEDAIQTKTTPQKRRFRRVYFYITNWINLFTFHNLKKLRDVKIKHVVVATSLSLILAFFIRTIFFNKSEDKKNGSLLCYKDYVSGGGVVCRPQCGPGYYSLPWMQECQKYLTCKEIQSTDISLLDAIGGGAVKGVYLAKYKNDIVAYNSLQNPLYRQDFNHGIGMLRQFQSGNKVTQLLGYCKTFFITEYQSLGDATNFETLLQERNYKHLDTMSMRMKMCVNYVEIIEFFHNHHSGTRVFCDSNTLQDTLKQYLITHSFSLIANDLDALPLLKKGGKIKCGNREIGGEFAAPEQIWPEHLERDDYDDSLLSGYDEKVDIWKIPDVCLHFLGSSQESDIVKLHLFKIHSLCKSELPKARPGASKVLKEYRKVQTELLL